MFGVSDEQRLAVESFRRFAEKRLRPLGDRYEKAGAPPSREETIALFREIGEFGLLGALVRDEDGGSGIGMIGLALFSEEIARAAVFLCDPANDYISGSSLIVDAAQSLAHSWPTN